MYFQNAKYQFSEMLVNELLLFKVMKEMGVFFHYLIMTWGCSMTNMYLLEIYHLMVSFQSEFIYYTAIYCV